jgi:multidrug resistance efflux pump
MRKDRLGVDNAISTIERKIGEAEKKDEKQQAAVAQERTTLRSEMTQRAEKTAEGIAELNKQTAVLSTRLRRINAELIKIGQHLAAAQAEWKN